MWPNRAPYLKIYFQLITVVTIIRIKLQVHAIDLDKGENGDVRYELSKGHGELFKVDRKTGEISLKQILEGHNKEYQLIITAYDGGAVKFISLPYLQHPYDYILNSLAYFSGFMIFYLLNTKS